MKIIILVIFFILGIWRLSVTLLSGYDRARTRESASITSAAADSFKVISAAPAPKSYLISTAFIPQSPEKNWDQPWQDACEEASLLTLKYFYLQSTPSIPEMLSGYQSLFDYEAQKGNSHDLNLKEMADVASAALGLKPQLIDNPSLADIKESLLKNIPVIVTANGKTLYRENKHFKSGGPWYHSLVILGFDDRVQKFTVHDVGTQFGAYFKYSYKLLLESIHDFPVSGRKEDIDSGAKRILLLLE